MNGRVEWRLARAPHTWLRTLGESFMRDKGRNLILTLAIITSVLLGGCLSTSQVLEIGRDTYSVSATGDGFRDAASTRQSAFEAGSNKCAALGKRFMLMNESTARTRMGIDTTVNVTFRCLSENDPEYARPYIQKAPDVVIEDQRKQ